MPQPPRPHASAPSSRPLEPTDSAPAPRTAGRAGATSHPVCADASREPLRFHVNGEPRESAHPLTLDGLLESCGLGGLRVAVAINARVIARSRYAETQIQPEDRIEIIHAVGGG